MYTEHLEHTVNMALWKYCIFKIIVHHHWAAVVPVVGRRPQHAVSKLACLVLPSAISCRSSICPGRLSTAWLVSLVLSWWHAGSIGRLWGGWCALFSQVHFIFSRCWLCRTFIYDYCYLSCVAPGTQWHPQHYLSCVAAGPQWHPPTVVTPWVQSVHCMHNLPSPIKYNGLTDPHCLRQQPAACIYIHIFNKLAVS